MGATLELLLLLLSPLSPASPPPIFRPSLPLHPGPTGRHAAPPQHEHTLCRVPHSDIHRFARPREPPPSPTPLPDPGSARLQRLRACHGPCPIQPSTQVSGTRWSDGSNFKFRDTQCPSAVRGEHKLRRVPPTSNTNSLGPRWGTPLLPDLLLPLRHEINWVRVGR